MINKNKFLGFLVLWLSFGHLELVASGQADQIPQQNYAAIDSGPSATPQKQNGQRVKADLVDALAVIKSRHIHGKTLNYNRIFKSSIASMLRTLDPYSKYYDAHELDVLKSDPRSSTFGIGLTIGNRKIGGETSTFVFASMPHSPAENAGLRFGDKIIAVDNWDVKGQSLAKVRERLRGTRGSRVKLTIERAADHLRHTIETKRDVVSQPSVPDAYLLRPGVGYIDMGRGLNHRTIDELIEKLDQLHGEGMNSLVLDLRENTGGFFDQVVRVSEQFLSEGQIIFTQGNSKTSSADRRYKSNNRNPEKSPLVVLVGRKTASGAEMIAGALQDHDRALIVGETTLGLSLVRSIIPLEYGSALNLTSSKVFMPSGRLIQRDYSNRGYYENETRGASQQQRVERKTDTGRSVYGGEGIVPDERLKPRELTSLEQMMIDPIFEFARELVNARIKGLESYVVRRPIDPTHVLKPEEFVVTDSLFSAFKDFVARTPGLTLTEQQLNANREFVARQLRYDLVTAAYGPILAARILRADDPQVLKAIEVLPRAAALAAAPRNR